MTSMRTVVCGLIPGLTARIADRAAYDRAQLRVQAVCPSRLLPAAQDAIALAASQIMRLNGEAGKPSLRVLRQAADYVYQDLARGWLPSDRKEEDQK